jgi:hypothetical protein
MSFESIPKCLASRVRVPIKKTKNGLTATA